MPAKKNPESKRVSAPIRMSEELAEKVQEAARRTGLAQADILRMALAIGLEDLKRVDYDIPRLVSEAARPEAAPAGKRPKLELLNKVAEEVSGYRYTKET